MIALKYTSWSSSWMTWETCQPHGVERKAISPAFQSDHGWAWSEQAQDNHDSLAHWPSEVGSRFLKTVTFFSVPLPRRPDGVDQVSPWRGPHPGNHGKRWLSCRGRCLIKELVDGRVAAMPMDSTWGTVRSCCLGLGLGGLQESSACSISLVSSVTFKSHRLFS